MSGPLKSFTTAASASIATKDGEAEEYPFEVDGVQCIGYKPDEAQLAMALSSMGKYATQADQVAGVINFLVGVLDKKSASYIGNRLLDRFDPFGLKEVEGIIEWLIEEWSGRPTQLSSGSTSSPKDSGLSLTVPTPAST